MPQTKPAIVTRALVWTWGQRGEQTRGGTLKPDPSARHCSKCWEGRGVDPSPGWLPLTIQQLSPTMYPQICFLKKGRFPNETIDSTSARALWHSQTSLWLRHSELNPETVRLQGGNISASHAQFVQAAVRKENWWQDPVMRIKKGKYPVILLGRSWTHGAAERENSILRLLCWFLESYQKSILMSCWF